MEDCKISYDYTVRAASGNIVQFLYGEDGMDAAKIESQKVLYIDKDFTKLKYEYLLTKEDKLNYFLDEKTVKEFTAINDWEVKFKEHFEQVLKDREYLIKKVFKSKKESTILYPISLMRIVNNAMAVFKDKGLSDLNPMYVLDTIEKVGDELFVSKINRGNMLLQMLLRCYLSPKKMIFEYKFNKTTFDYIIEQIKMKFYDAIAHPSEMVGVIAAQSIGEPSTQMSCVKDTIIRISGKDECYNGPIGPFIDKLLEKNKNKIIKIGNDSVVMDLEEDYTIIGVSNDEKTSWNRISQISRHPANGGLVKVTTLSGKTTTATMSHSFLKRTEKGIEPILGSDLKVGQRIPIAKSIPELKESKLFISIGEFGEVPLTREFGWLCGAYLADGCVTYGSVQISKVIPEYRDKIKEIVENIFELNVTYKEEQSRGFDYITGSSIFNSTELSVFFSTHFGKGSYNKNIPAWTFMSNKEFIAGVIGGYFDGDGNVNSKEGKQMIRSGSVSETLTSDMIGLLSYFDIFASKCIEKPKAIDYKDFHTIQISRKYARVFKEEIGFIVKEKDEAVDKIIEYIDKDRKSDKEMIDMIPELGNVIGYIGEKLKLPGQSRTYKRWIKKEAIGRKTLMKYINIFEEANTTQNIKEVDYKINILKQAAYSDVVWDQITDIQYIDDPKEYVYDFTVPGNDSFMVDTGVLVHNTLNTFHLSGVSSASKAVRGVPRIKELLSVTKNIKAPALTIYLKDQYKQDKMQAKKILNTIETTYFSNIVKSTKIYYDPDDFNTTIEDDKFFIETYKEFIDQEMIKVNNKSPWLLRLEFDKAKMLENDISMMEIYNALQDFYTDELISVMFSDDNASKLIFRIKINENDDKHDDLITDLKALEKNLLENLIVKGIKKVSKVIMNKSEYFAYNEDTLDFDKISEWILETSGTNLVDIFAHRKVDAARTISNDINEIYEVLGIEAARQALFNEISDVMKFADLYVNYRHVALLVDTMTNKGYLLSIDRHGINRVDIGPLAKSSFEETNDMIVKAGIFSEVDKINGVSAAIILGQLPLLSGTSATDILIDEAKLMSIEGIAPKEPAVEINPEDVCANIAMEYHVPTTDKPKKKLKKQTVKIV